MNYRTDRIKHEILTVKYLTEFYSRGFLRLSFAHKENFSNDGIDYFSSAREQITITGSKFLEGIAFLLPVSVHIMILWGTGRSIFAPRYVISIFEKVTRGVKFRTIISCHRIQNTP